jgi:hypothetical protein
MRLGYEPKINAKGERLICLEAHWLDKLTAPRGLPSLNPRRDD